MREHNLELRRERGAILTADASIDRVWLDLVPAVTLTYSVNRAMTSAGSDSQSNFSVFAFLNIPGMIGVRMRYYAAVLSLVRAEYGYALKEREQTIALWQAFRAARRLEEKKAWARFARDKNLAAGLGAHGSGTLGEYLSDYALKQEELGLRDRLAKLLGDYTAEWAPDADTAPVCDYTKVKADLTKPAEWGLLLNKYTATELEGARLRRLGATLQYWPDVSVSVQSPPLYSKSGGAPERVWSSDEMRVHAQTSLRLDTTLSTTYSLMETRRQVALLHAFLRQGTQERIRKLEMQDAYVEVMLAREAEVKRRVVLLLAAPPSASLAEYSVWADNFKNTLSERSRLAEERDALDAVYWFIDEGRWPDPMQARWIELDKAKVDAELDFLDKYADGGTPPPKRAAGGVPDMPSH